MGEQILSPVHEVMTQLAIAAATIQAQSKMIEALKKQVPEPISYVDLERQDHENFEREQS